MNSIIFYASKSRKRGMKNTMKIPWLNEGVTHTIYVRAQIVVNADALMALEIGSKVAERTGELLLNTMEL